MGQASKTKDKVKDFFFFGGGEPIFCWNVREKQRKGEERVSKAFLDNPRSSIDRNSSGQEPKFIYAWVPKMRGFTEDPKEEISGNQIFRAREASYPCYYALGDRDASYFGLFSALRAI